MPPIIHYFERNTQDETQARPAQTKQFLHSQENPSNRNNQQCSPGSPSHSRQMRQQGTEPASMSSLFISLELPVDESAWFSSRGSESLGFRSPDGSSCTSPFIDEACFQKKSITFQTLDESNIKTLEKRPNTSFSINCLINAGTETNQNSDLKNKIK